MSPRKPVVGIITNFDYDPYYIFPGYRRVTLSQDYPRSIAAAGGVPVLLPPSPDLSTLSDQLGLVDALLLAGGPDVAPLLYGQAAMKECQAPSPVRDAFELEALRLARQGGLPVLGICRGMQVINVVLGGTLFQDLRYAGTERQHMALGNPASPLHHISVTPGSFLDEAWGTGKATVDSFHHQGLDRVAGSLEIVARADDGVVEVVEYTGDEFRLAAAHWPPEMMSEADERARQLFSWFVETVGERLAEAA